MLDIKGIRTESRKEMYLKYNKSNYFTNLQSRDKPEKVTGKITNIPYFKKFEPLYDNKNARERYMTDFWPKDKIASPVAKPKKEKPNLKLNANDIVCRDLYNGYNSRDYKERLSRPKYLKRSYTCSNLENANMSSRLRKIYNMSSNIFFTEKDNDNITNTIVPKEKEQSECSSTRGFGLKRSKTFRNLHKRTQSHVIKSPIKPPELYLNTVNPQVNHRHLHSLYATNADWKYTNTEPRQKTTESKIKKVYNRKNLLSRGEDELEKTYSTTNTYANTESINSTKANIESVKYDIISTEPNSRHRKSISSLINQHAKPGQIENYEIIVDNKFAGANARLIKNLFYSEGIHLFKFEEQGSGVNGYSNGKFTFRIRKNDDDKEYARKMSEINKKIKKKNMQLIKKDTSTIRTM